MTKANHVIQKAQSSHSYDGQAREKESLSSNRLRNDFNSTKRSNQKQTTTTRLQPSVDAFCMELVTTGEHSKQLFRFPFAHTHYASEKQKQCVCVFTTETALYTNVEQTREEEEVSTGSIIVSVIHTKRASFNLHRLVAAVCARFVPVRIEFVDKGLREALRFGLAESFGQVEKSLNIR